MSTRNFSSTGAYRRWLAYGHMRTASGSRAGKGAKSVFASTPGHQKVKIAGQAHKVRHTSSRRRRG